jgi:hypothetical protein
MGGKRVARQDCRGREGTPHEPHIQLGVVGRLRIEARHKACHWRDQDRYTRGGYYARTWTCGHEEVCFTCGEILRYSLPSSECPHYDSKAGK